ncbi:hypothetical protein Bca101_048851 [Brassica carinata]
MFSRVSLSTAISSIFSYGPQIIPITTRLGNFDGERLRRPCYTISPKSGAAYFNRKLTSLNQKTKTSPQQNNQEGVYQRLKNLISTKID